MHEISPQVYRIYFQPSVLVEKCYKVWILRITPFLSCNFIITGNFIIDFKWNFFWFPPVFPAGTVYSKSSKNIQKKKKHTNLYRGARIQNRVKHLRRMLLAVGYLLLVSS